MRALLALSAVAALVGTLSSDQPPPSDPVAAGVPDVASRAEATGSVPEPEDARRQMEIGRYWHASVALRESPSSDDRSDASRTLLLARAEAGWENWPAVIEELEGAPWLDREGDGVGWLHLGRAFEEVEETDEAVHAYGRFLTVRGGEDGPTGDTSGDRVVARVRRARLLAGMGAVGVAVEELHRVSGEAPWAAGWMGMELAASAAERGAVDAVRQALSSAPLPGGSDRARRLEADALLMAGDTTGALESLVALATAGVEGEARRSAWGRVGDLRLATGDTSVALRAYRNGASEAPVPVAVARGLLAVGLQRPEDARVAFRVLARRGGAEEALSALERLRELEEIETLSASRRLQRARLLERAGRPEEAVDVLRDLAGMEEEAVAAPALDQWSDIRRSQGRRGDARVLQNRLVDRYPSHPAAVDVVFFRADDRHDAGDLTGAARGYRRIVKVAPELDRSGLARMRLGQIHLTRGSPAEAAEVFEGYLEATPRGAYWEEAAYWAAESRRALGREDRTRELVDRIRDGNPLSYYAIQGARLLDEPYEPPVSDGEAPPEVEWISREVERALRLRQAGLDEGARSRIDEARRRAEDDDRALLRLSLELSEAGFSLEGIRLAWELRDRGHDWNRWLLRAVYPFPYRELVGRESEEWGLDPFFLAALVRQESAFVAGIRSGAGAVGLTQVVPSTGRSLARSVGPTPFHDRILTHPEINLHLGGAYLAELTRRFQGHLPLLLSAYNAGPTRARRWSERFADMDDPLRFTERIPFGETREYVKRVRRNVEIYRWLYDPAPGSSVGTP